MVTRSVQSVNERCIKEKLYLHEAVFGRTVVNYTTPHLKPLVPSPIKIQLMEYKGLWVSLDVA